jgi:hypothetical protein
LRVTTSAYIFAQLDVPVGEVNEVFPTVVLLQAEADLDKRTPFRALGFADEVHAGLLRRAVGLVRVAFDAGADDVFPRRRPAAVARDDVVEVQILAVKNFAAILAGVLVALKNVVARELDLLLRQPVIHEQQDDARHADAEGNGVDGFVVRRVGGKVAPFVKLRVRNEPSSPPTTTCAWP